MGLFQCFSYACPMPFYAFMFFLCFSFAFPMLSLYFYVASHMFFRCFSCAFHMLSGPFGEETARSKLLTRWEIRHTILQGSVRTHRRNIRNKILKSLEFEVFSGSGRAWGGGRPAASPS